jgi:ribonuclease HI
LRNATASIGVYFGPGASTNIKDVLEENDFGRPFFVEANRYKVRSEFAQLMACYHALHAVQQSYFQKVFADDHGNGNLSQVVIKTDSTELFHGMTRLIFGWEQTNWKEKGKPVPHSEIFKEIQHLVAELNNVEVQVLFWKVMRDNNDKAHDLARQALTERFGRNAIKSRPPLSPATLQRRDERARRVLGLAPI